MGFEHSMEMIRSLELIRTLLAGMGVEAYYPYYSHSWDGMIFIFLVHLP